jgi:hypothetical protein
MEIDCYSPDHKYTDNRTNRKQVAAKRDSKGKNII